MVRKCRKYTQQDMNNLDTKKEEANKSGKQPDIDEIARSLNKLRTKLLFINFKLRWTRFKPKLLRVGWGVVLPCTLEVKCTKTLIFVPCKRPKVPSLLSITIKPYFSLDSIMDFRMSNKNV